MIYIVGIVGVPNQYGGFETLAENLLNSKKIIENGVSVYCEKDVALNQNYKFKGASLIPLPFKANGWQSVLFDLTGILKSSFRKESTVLILGASSATFILPICRIFFPSTKYIVNMAGLEWSRDKFNSFAKMYIKLNERFAAYYAHKFITDNEGLQLYVHEEYGIESNLIAYGGDQYLNTVSDYSVHDSYKLPERYDFAMSRAQVDNNLEKILNAYVMSGENLVFISNWSSSDYGTKIYNRYKIHKNIFLVYAIYDTSKIKAIFEKARFYIHGHSAGGTNPVLVEAMWNQKPIIAFNNKFNNFTTENEAVYFKSSDDINSLIKSSDNDSRKAMADSLYMVAKNSYSWDNIISQYEDILLM